MNSKNQKFIYYANGGSGNHGCEAIIRSLEEILSSNEPNILLATSPHEDLKYGLGNLVEIQSLSNQSHKNFTYLKSYLDLKFGKSCYALDIFPYIPILKKNKDTNRYLALSVGGDNYCYGGTAFYKELDKTIHKLGYKTAMVGCSIEPDVISDNNVKEDLCAHSLIIARESLTYEALQANGLKNSILLPDPAFVLKRGNPKQPVGFSQNNTIGINLSPLVEKCSSDGKIVSKNIDSLIQYIIDNTSMQVALIPHVIWKQSNDMDALMPLFEKYRHTDRVILIKDTDAESLKGHISRCRFLVAARTHASIAAYSTCVPTLVIGYSIKSLGIAKDIFGTSENYVIPSQSLTTERAVVEGFKWLYKNEDSIREHLQSFMPEYCKKAYLIKEELESISK